MRPLSDRVSGIDGVVCRRGAQLGVPSHLLSLARVAAAVFVRRHGDLIDYLADGGQPELLVADGVVPYWPDNAVVWNGLPLQAVEMAPVGAAVVAELGGDAADAAEVCSVLVAFLRRRRDRTWLDDVAMEMLEAFVFADLMTRPSANR